MKLRAETHTAIANRIPIMRWLVLGSRGMFGSDMLEYLKNLNEDASGLNSEQVDLTKDIEFIEDRISEFDVVINAAAFTNVKLAETEEAKAFELNAEVPAKLAQIASSNNQKLIHISTDYVFDGTQQSPYLTTDRPNPINVYGQSKLDGERLIQKHDARALIIRTSWLYGPNGNCFPRAIVKKIEANQSIEVVDDQFGTPTSTWFLRKFVYDSIRANFEGGIHHGVPKGNTSWHGFASEIAAGYESKITSKPTIMSGGIAKRPRHGQLSPHPSTTITWEECWDQIRQEFIGG